MFMIIVLTVFVIEFLRINQVNKFKFLNADDPFLFLNIKIYFLNHYFIQNPEYTNSLALYTAPYQYGKISKLCHRHKIYIF